MAHRCREQHPPDRNEQRKSRRARYYVMSVISSSIVLGVLDHLDKIQIWISFGS